MLKGPYRKNAGGIHKDDLSYVNRVVIRSRKLYNDPSAVGMAKKRCFLYIKSQHKTYKKVCKAVHIPSLARLGALTKARKIKLHHLILLINAGCHRVIYF